MITKLFPPSRTKVLKKSQRLMRNDGYTTNGYWLIKTEFEPEWMEELKEKDGKPEVLGLIERATAQELVELTRVTDMVRIDGGVPIVVFKDGMGDQVLVDAFYLSFFIKCFKKQRFDYFKPPHERTLIVKSGQTILGLVKGMYDDH